MSSSVVIPITLRNMGTSTCTGIQVSALITMQYCKKIMNKILSVVNEPISKIIALVCMLNDKRNVREQEIKIRRDLILLFNAVTGVL